MTATQSLPLSELLLKLQRKGVRLWVDDGRLRFKAPSGVVTREELDLLKDYRPQVVALLGNVAAAEVAQLRSRDLPRHEAVPLSFSQLAWWRLYRLCGKPSSRCVVAAVRLQGRMEVDALSMSIAEVVRRHEALRTRIVVRDGSPVQVFDDMRGCQLQAEDVREIEVLSRIERLVLESIDVALGPVFGALLMRVSDEDHVLALAIDHIVADLRSLNIVLGEIFDAYEQAVRGRSITLVAVPLQFGDYAFWQRSAQLPLIEERGKRCLQRLAACGRMRFPEEAGAVTEGATGWDCIALRVDTELTQALREWCRLRRTTLVMGVFAAYAALTLRWCRVTRGAIQYQSNGRVAPGTDTAVGFFSSRLYLGVELRGDDTFDDILTRVVAEYCAASEEAEFSYLEAQVPPPEFSCNTLFNWTPQASGTDRYRLVVSGEEVKISPMSFVNPWLDTLGWDNEPTIQLWEGDGEIGGTIYFPRNRFSAGLMERFGCNFMRFLDVLVKQTDRRIADVTLQR